jgi:hypothetical protein
MTIGAIVRLHGLILLIRISYEVSIGIRGDHNILNNERWSAIKLPDDIITSLISVSALLSRLEAFCTNGGYR